MSDDLIELLRDPVVCYLATDTRFRLANEIERNRAAIAELVGALKIAEEFINRHSEPWYTSGQQDLTTIRALITKYNHIVDANKMVPPALYLCTKCGGANYGCGCDSFKHCTVPLYTNQTEKE